jgi:hypothetical protein
MASGPSNPLCDEHNKIEIDADYIKFGMEGENVSERLSIEQESDSDICCNKC